MLNSSKNNFLLPVVLAGCVCLGLWLGSTFSPKGFEFSATEGGENVRKIQEIITVLDRKYVDSVNANELFEKTISDMLHELDPHSNYIPAKDMQALNESIEGKFGGVGLRFFILRDTICVTNVIIGSPASSVGLMAGDKILQIDGKKVAGKKITNDKVMSKLKGKENTSVSLKILRNRKVLNKRIIRGSIPIESVVSAYMIKPHVGFIKIEEFSLTTSEEFRNAANFLKNLGMKKLILDLRNNGGGVMQSANEIADEFLKDGVPIVSTKGEHIGSKTYYATEEGVLENTSVVVLINANSASASEILAGAIQDNDRGIIMGRRSFGKGLVQEDVQLTDGSNLRLTIARYYTPTGRCIQKPYEESYDEYINSQIERYDNGELYAPDSTLFVDSLKFKTPKKRIVYGGGGIMPDIFVPFDSSGTSWYYTDLRFSQAFQAFAFDYVQDKRLKWKSVADFDKNFVVNDALINKFVRFSEKEIKIKTDKKGLAHSKALIAKTIKAEIARQLWLEDGYFQILNKTDNEVQAAVKKLN